MDAERLKELAGVAKNKLTSIQLNERMPGYEAGYGGERSQESQVIGMVLSNLRTMQQALEQGNMEGVQEELNKAMTMLAQAKSGK